MEPGPVTREQLERLGRVWKQGDHLLVSAPTQSGKTTLTRHIVQNRIDRGGFAVVLVCKIRPDPTIEKDYRGWTRWERMKPHGPKRSENQVLLYPNLDGIPATKAKEIQKEIFKDAYDRISVTGNWCVVTDEGLYVCNPSFLNLSDELAILHALGASSGVTNVVLTQRPSHLPLVIYGSASHAFVGRTREQADLKRLQELGGRESAKSYMERISAQERRDFLWIPVGPDWPAEKVNLRN